MVCATYTSPVNLEVGKVLAESLHIAHGVARVLVTYLFNSLLNFTRVLIKIKTQAVKIR